MGYFERPELLEISTVPRNQPVVLWIEGALDGFFAIGAVDDTDTIHLDDGSYDLSKAVGWCALPDEPAG